MGNKFNERLDRGKRSDVVNRSREQVVTESRFLYPKNEIGQDLLAEDLEVVLSTNEGRRVIWHLLEESTIFDGGFELTNSKAFIVNGKKSIGHVFWKIMSTKLSSLLPSINSNIKKDKEWLRTIVEIRQKKKG